MNKYGSKSQEKVAKAIRKMQEGKLRSVRSGAKVMNRKQAEAIELSETRKFGGKVPKKL